MATRSIEGFDLELDNATLSVGEKTVCGKTPVVSFFLRVAKQIKIGLS